ncbi:MAG: hypothetical protein ACP5GJ_02385 [Nanopusillaceae archaeon]|jgi:hypothetical protein
MVTLLSSCDKTCLSAKSNNPKIFYNDKVNEIRLEEILDKIKENNNKICSSCNNEVSIAASYLIFPYKTSRNYIKEIKKRHDGFLEMEALKGSSIADPMILYLYPNYNIIISSQPDIIRRSNSNAILIEEISTKDIGKAWQPINIINLLLMKKYEVMIFAYILKEVFPEMEVRYKVKLFLVGEYQGLSNEIKDFNKKYKEIIVEGLKVSEIEVSSYSKYNAVLLSFWEEFTEGKKSYIKRKIEDNIKYLMRVGYINISENQKKNE